MRKYLIGIFIGVALTISTSVFAEDVISLIGQKIQGEFPIKINGETLEKPAIVINGTSYLPNRAIADALGMDIKFDTDLGISLTNKEEVMTTPDSTLSQSVGPEVTDTTYSLEIINGKITETQINIDFINNNIERVPPVENPQIWQDRLKKAQDELDTWEARKAELQ